MRAVEFLYGLELTQYDWAEHLAPFWDKHSTKLSAQEYAEKLIAGVMEHRDELDGLLGDSLTNWTWERVDPVERSVLRIAAYEMVRCDDVPVKVAINEAIEIVRTYGSDDSPKFVNGVLDKLKQSMEQ